MSTQKHIFYIVTLFIGVIFWFQGAIAQDTKIIVIDQEFGQPLPYAHVHFNSTTTHKKEIILTNAKGEASLPKTPGFESRIAIHITYLGFTTINDTVKLGSTTKVKMKESIESLDQVVVTAQFSESTPEKALHKITLISRDKIEALNAVSLDQVLARELNMNISQDGITGSSISIQGLSGENVKILIDGVPMVGRLNGSIDLSQINLNDVERIEVVEGPLSVSYGSNALAGTINLITKKGSKKPITVSGKYYGENIGTHNVDARLGFSKGKNYGGLTFTRNFFDGWNIGDPVWGNPEPIADSSRVKLWKPRTQLLAGLKYGRKLKKGTILFNIQGFDETIINRGYPRGQYDEIAFDDEYLTKRLDNSITLDLKLDTINRLQVIAAYNMYQRERLSYVTDLTGVSSIPNELPGVSDTNFTDLKMLRTTFTRLPKGKSYRYQLGIDFNNETVKGKRILDEKQSIGDYAVFLSLEWQPSFKWTIKPGLRTSYNTSYSSPVVPSLYAKYQIKPSMSLRGSIARGFRAPSVKELYMDFVDINHDIHGNPDLVAESAIHASLNYTYTYLKKAKTLKFKFGLFYNYIENKITLAQSGNTQYEYANIDEALSLGFNTDAQYTFGHFKTSLGFSYTGTENTIRESDPISIFFSPQVTSSVSYAWRKQKTDFSVFYKFSGEQPNFIVGEDGEIQQSVIGSYSLLDFTASKKIWKDRLILGAGVKNILDVTNVNSGSSSGSHGTTDGTRPIAPGRVYFVKLGFQF
ncbi:MAG: TonB-dependent receptor [Salibacteraceae bacterium]